MFKKIAFLSCLAISLNAEYLVTMNYGAGTSDPWRSFCVDSYYFTRESDNNDYIKYIFSFNKLEYLIPTDRILSVEKNYKYITAYDLNGHLTNFCLPIEDDTTYNSLGISVPWYNFLMGLFGLLFGIIIMIITKYIFLKVNER